MTGPVVAPSPPALAASITLGAAPDGTLTYLVAHAASDLPPVRGRDILTAWEAAREAAQEAVHEAVLHAASEVGRAVRFQRADGGWTDLSLQDRDARCWAAAVDRVVGLRTGYGLSVCLRLLALVDLLARAPWVWTDGAVRLVRLDRSFIDLDPALLRLAAETRLTDDAGFDEARLRARFHPGPGPGPGPQLSRSPVPRPAEELDHDA